MVLLDWTRMGKLYCLAGIVRQNGELRVVRPLPIAQRTATVRNVGWSPFSMDGHSRWEIFELLDPKPAEPSPPHLEDLWVSGLHSRLGSVDPVLRRAILQATLALPNASWFGAPLTTTRTAAYLTPRTGRSSLVTIQIPSRSLHFTAAWRDGTPDGTSASLLRVEFAADRGASLHMEGIALAQRAVRTMADAVRQLCARRGRNPNDVVVVAHGGNGRMPALLAHRLGLTLERVWSETSQTGNLGSASLPVAWNARAASTSQSTIWTAVGAGLQWGAALFDP